MKKHTIHLTILFFILTTACKDFLDRPEPTDVLPIEVAIQNQEELEQATLGVYSFITNLDNDILIPADVMSDNVQWVGIGNTLPWRLLNNVQLNPDNPIIEFIWEWSYKAINQANLVLEKLDETPGLEPIFMSQTRGELLFLRGMIYFQLTRYFGKPYGANSDTDLAVPILTQATISVEEVTFPSRATVQEVYAQVISDLTEASELLPERSGQYRANKAAAIAYLAQIAFQQQKYTSASQLAEEVINSGYQLTIQPQDVFLKEGSSEEIWFLPHSTQERGFMAGITQIPNMLLSLDLSAQGFNAIIPDKQRNALQQQGLEVLDLRQTSMIIPSPQPGQFESRKYEDRAGGGDDAPMLRLAEFILMRSEALVHTQGINQESIDLLNTIRRRSLRVVDSLGQEFPAALSGIEYQISDFNSPEELIETIVAERRIELFLEGNRFHDLIRLQKPIQGLSYDSPCLRFPIPQIEIDANSNLVQNEGC